MISSLEPQKKPRVKQTTEPHERKRRGKYRKLRKKNQGAAPPYLTTVLRRTGSTRWTD